MIGTVEVKIAAYNVSRPLTPLFSFNGSPSSLRIIDVPKSIGTWNITNVKLIVKYPDNTSTTKTAVRSGSVWVATVDGCTTNGRVKNGYEIVADGVDESGNNVTGYVLGAGDVIVLDRDSRIDALDEKAYMKICDDVPATPALGDVLIINDTIKFFNGTSWITQKMPQKTSELTNDSGYITEDDVPTKVSELTNDSGFIDETEKEAIYSAMPNKLSQLANDANYAKTTQLPTKTSELTNDSGFITSDDVPTKVSELSNDKNYVEYYQVENTITDVTNIKALIPEGASAENELADKSFVNSSIATNTAHFKGTFNSVAELAGIEDPTENDYAFVVSTDSSGNTVYGRYKCTMASGWVFEYNLNNSSFTAAQWATINSGLTSTTLNDYPKKTEIDATRIYSTSTAKVTPANGDKLITGAGLTYQYSSDKVWNLKPDDNDPRKDSSTYELCEYAPEGTMDWTYVLKIDGVQDIVNEFEERQTSLELRYGYDSEIHDYRYTYTATYDDVGWVQNGEVATKAYVDSKIDDISTVAVSGEYEDGTTFSFNLLKSED